MGFGPLYDRVAAVCTSIARTLFERHGTGTDGDAPAVQVFSQASADERCRARIDEDLSRLARAAGTSDANDGLVLALVADLVMWLADRSPGPADQDGEPADSDDVVACARACVTEACRAVTVVCDGQWHPEGVTCRYARQEWEPTDEQTAEALRQAASIMARRAALKRQADALPVQ